MSHQRIDLRSTNADRTNLRNADGNLFCAKSRHKRIVQRVKVYIATLGVIHAKSSHERMRAIYFHQFMRICRNESCTACHNSLLPPLKSTRHFRIDKGRKASLDLLNRCHSLPPCKSWRGGVPPLTACVRWWWSVLSRSCTGA